MKTLVFSGLLFFVLFSSSFSQSLKGTVVLGGNMSYQKSSPSGITEMETFSVSPGVGFFPSDNIMIGINIGYQNSESSDRGVEYIERVSNSSHLISFSPYFRYYIPLFNKVYFMGQAAVSFGFGEIENKAYTSIFPGVNTITFTNDVNILELSLSPGISFNLNDWILLEASLGMINYRKTTYEADEPFNDSKSITENYNLSFNLNSINLGIQFML